MILQIVEIGAFLKLDLIAPWGPGQMFVAGGPRGEDVTEAILRGASEVWILGWDDGMMGWCDCSCDMNSCLRMY